MAQFYGGPSYCETPADPALWTFPVEPFNTASNGVIVMFGLLGFYFVAKRAPRQYDLYLLCLLLTLTGIGSGIWHGLRDGQALFWEVRSGLFFLFAIVFCWARRLWSYPGAVIALAAFYFGFDASREIANNMLGIPGRWLAITPLVLGFGGVMVAQTAFRAKDAALTGGLALAAALTAVTFRTLDQTVCQSFPIGTHFLWHSFLSAGGFLGIITLIRLPAWNPGWFGGKQAAQQAAE